MEDGGADEACGSGEDEMHFADGMAQLDDMQEGFREESMERKGTEGR